jgi:hypothetical protein
LIEAQRLKARGAQLRSLHRCRDFRLAAQKLSFNIIFSIEEHMMERFDYDAAADLYPSRRYAKSAQTRYRRFDRAADAISYVIEELPATWLPGTFLEVGDLRLEGSAIRALYDAPGYPLPRTVVAA